MSETKHTPGPWTAERRHACWAICNHNQPGRFPEIVFLPDHYEYMGEQAGCVTSRKPQEEIDANAHLIAAAPDLLAAAKQFLADWNRNQNDENPRPLEAAIAKAEGKEHNAR